jgi:integrase
VRRKGVRYPMTRTALRRRWDEVCAYLGIPDLNWHRLRATTATHMKRAVRDGQMVMKLTGHKDEKAFNRYTEANTEAAMIAEMMMAFDIEELLLAAKPKKPAAVPVLKLVSGDAQ